MKNSFHGDIEIGEVYFDEGEYVFRGKGFETTSLFVFLEDIEVISNIYENPELREKK